MPSDVSLEEEFVNKVKEEEANFDEEICSLHDDQIAAFHLCCDLRQDLTKLSKAQKYRLLRTRKLLQQVFLHIGAEVFLLCVLAASITVLGKLDQKILFPRLRRWWKSVTVKVGLRDTTQKLYEASKIGDLFRDTAIGTKGRQELSIFRDSS